jgi:hypothetical protein
MVGLNTKGWRRRRRRKRKIVGVRRMRRQVSRFHGPGCLLT